MGGGGSAPQTPVFHPIDIGQVSSDAFAADVAGFDFADKDFLTRFPGLAIGNQQQIEDTYKQLTGPLDPTIQNSFVTKGVSDSLGSFGGGNPLATLGTPGKSIASNAVGKSLATSVMNKQDTDRNYFDSLIAKNPQRALGLSGTDVANLSIANTGALSANQQQSYAGQVANANADQAASNQNIATGVGATVALTSALIAAGALS